ncbi:MAG: hypothetical protein KAG19_02265 [Methylococcales bacterium]|nr:hypothetical protein [Methylococcales bacterium]
MFIFICLNLVIGLLVKMDMLERLFFLSDGLMMTGIFLLVIAAVAQIFKLKKVSWTWRYDLFAIGSLLVWFGYWPPFFREESPVFYAYPLYFAFVTAFFSLLVANGKAVIDTDEVKRLKGLPSFGMSNPLIVMGAVAASLYFPQHFMLYPITMTLLIIRFSLACCLEGE